MKRQKDLQLEPGNSGGQPTAIRIDLKIECWGEKQKKKHLYHNLILFLYYTYNIIFI